MSFDTNQRLYAPLLDRLLECNRGRDFNQPYQVLRQLRESVRRDLEHLLNTRYCCLSPPADTESLTNSLLNYGLPDLATVNLTAVDSRRAFCRDIEKTILRFEPRIQTVHVTSDDRLDREEPSIHFRVEALLRANPAPELIIFDSTLNPITQTVAVAEIQ